MANLELPGSAGTATANDLIPATRLVRREKADVDGVRLAAAHAASVRGSLGFDAARRARYAHDASNYRRIPLGVVIPETQEDVVATVEACRRFGAPIVARGGGTALGGQTVNEAVVIDFSKRMKRILAIDPLRKRARVELGVVCDSLVDAAKHFNLTWGPKPATHSRCCFGGMLANNCGGMNAQWNGTAVKNTEALDVLLYDGTRLHLGWMTELELAARIEKTRGTRESEVLSSLRSLRDRYGERIRRGYHDFGRRISGYNLDELLPNQEGRFNLARLIVGSESTLALMLTAELELLDIQPHRSVVVLGYPDIFVAADAVPDLLATKPIGLESMDDLLAAHIRKKGGLHAKHMELLCDGKSWLFLEIVGPTAEDVRARCDEAIARAGRELVDSVVYDDPEQIKAIFDVREGALGSTAFLPGDPDGWPGWEDSAVPPPRLGEYLRELRKLYDAYGYKPALYGHFGMGVVHCRVPFNLYDEHGVRKFRRFLSDAADLVVSYGGSLSGEHGDGQARAELLVKMFGPELMTAMRELKAIFDPDHKMNPGKIVDPYPIVDHLKLYPDHSNGLAQKDLHFRYVEDGGSLAHAALRCVGIGRCRREHAEGDAHDVMCPSYLVTHEEKHSTRGRAHLLFEMLRSDGPIEKGWHDDSVKEALDLCLACKGCKNDCPVNVDIATYKAEFFSHYYEGRTRPRHAYAFGLIDRAARLAERAPGLANLVTQTPGLSALAKLAAGVALDAKIPAFAPESFRQRFARRLPHVVTPAGGRKVLLFVDTFNDHFHPDTLMATVEVLEAAGYEVVIPRRRVCCGRPLYDFGMLDRAKSYLLELLDVMKDEIAAGLPIVVAEPSCASVLKDELAGLFPERDDAKVLRQRTMMLGEFLVKEAKHFELPAFPKRRAIVQGHCHHRSVLDFASEKEAMERSGLELDVVGDGCCGMAGAFGFVSETREVGHAAGERALLPRVRTARADTFVIADGFSCREQIAQYTDRRGLHFAEVLKMALDGRIPSGRPERAIVARRKRAVVASMARAAIGLAAVALAGLLLRRVRRGRH
jgi:FAD/FMN-containing dehydrogenase/Fe-S oxidoreductase